jgi:hypothetical protein
VAKVFVLADVSLVEVVVGAVKVSDLTSGFLRDMPDSGSWILGVAKAEEVKSAGFAFLRRLTVVFVTDPQAARSS